MADIKAIKKALSKFTYPIVNIKLYNKLDEEVKEVAFTYLIVNIKQRYFNLLCAVLKLFTYLIVNIKP